MEVISPEQSIFRLPQFIPEYKNEELHSPYILLKLVEVLLFL